MNVNCYRLDSTNIFEFLIKWQRGKGLDLGENSLHQDYLQELCKEMVATLTEKISSVANRLDNKTGGRLYQEVM